MQHSSLVSFTREIEHEVKDHNAKDTSTDEFLDSPITQQLPKCNCGRMYEQLGQ